MHVREFHWMCNFSIFLNEFDTDTIKPIPLRFTAIIFLPIPGSKFVKFGAPLPIVLYLERCHLSFSFKFKKSSGAI